MGTGAKKDCNGSKVIHCQCLSRLGGTQVSALPTPAPIHFCGPGTGWAGPAGQPGLLLSSRGSVAMSNLQQPLKRRWEARKCWLVDLHCGWQALLTLGTAQRSPFPCMVNRQRHEGRRKPLLIRAQTQWMLHLAAASLRNHPSPGKNSFFIRITESYTNMGKEATSG